MSPPHGPHGRPIRAGGRTEAGFVGKAFDMTVALAGVPRGDGVRGQPPVLALPRGLCVWVTGSRAADVTLSVGVANGGADWSRQFMATASGAWLTVAGWGFAKLMVNTVGATDVRVNWAWTSEGPPGDDPGRLFYFETIVAGTVKVPEGAVGVTPSAADAGWTWTTEAVAATVLTIPTPLVAGTRQEVAGDRYTASVGNTLMWELWPL